MVDNVQYDVGFIAPALPHPSATYNPRMQEQMHSVLRMYFNQVDNVLRRTNSRVRSVTDVTADANVDPSLLDQIIRTSGSADITMTLLSSAPQGASVTFKHNGTGVLTIATEGSETIDGDSTLIVVNQYDAPFLTYNVADTEWSVV